MRTNRHAPLLALIAAGVLWGTTVPLSKVALAGIGPGWLAVARFALASLPLAWASRRHLRAAISPAIIAWGVAGYGVMIVLQNAGIAQTSVSHAALIAGAAPVLVALFTVALRRGTVRPAAWAGCVITLAGVGIIASNGAGGATLPGDALVFGSVLLSAAFVIAQPGLLAGRDPVAVTAVQLGAAAVGTVPAAFLTGDATGALPGPVPLLALAGLAIGGTLAPFTLFAYAQSRVSPAVAGAFLNLEPLVGAVIGALAFGNPLGPAQLAGGAAILSGVGLAATPLLGPGRRRDRPAPPAPATDEPEGPHRGAAGAEPGQSPPPVRDRRRSPGSRRQLPAEPAGSARPGSGRGPPGI